jgi:hypothetical protein
MFCPECGKPFGQTAAEAGLATAAEPVMAGEAQPMENTPGKVASKDDLVEGGAVHGARERTRETLHRASNVARGALEGNVKRVEKIHHVSSAMFEEAHYDPSLRFVLVAVGLFLVFVVLLILSKVMG